MIGKIREACRQVEVDAIIGYRKKEGEPREILHVFKPDEIDKITFSPLSSNNPARLLMEILPTMNKVAVIAKGCDVRAIRELVKENKIDRNKIYIIGVSCDGVVDYRKFRRAVQFRLNEIESVELDGEDLIVKANGKEQRFKFADVMSEVCKHCPNPTPKDYDVLIGEPKEGKEDFSDIEEIEKMSAEERWNYWMDIFSKCIRCHACRQVCPVCYCEECLVDPVNLAISPMTPAEEKASYPRVLGKTVNSSDNLIYHLVRVLHHAGRCARCGECERACPMELPLTKLERKLWKVVQEEFGYSPDEDIPFLSKLDMG
uniref:4Fe-4S ferredoxin n=1 Tax=Geoglobus ahangari TaxID=113653 RepID=A0A7C3UL97_9EURY